MLNNVVICSTILLVHIFHDNNHTIFNFIIHEGRGGGGGMLEGSYHEGPLLDFEHDDGASLGHPGQQHSDAADGQPAHVQAARGRVQLVNLGAPCPEGHQPAAREHWAPERGREGERKRKKKTKERKREGDKRKKHGYSFGYR